MKLAVFTVMLGEGAKALTEPLFYDEQVPMFCFTDRPHLVSQHWQIIQVPPYSQSAVRQQRMLKVLAHQTVEADWSLYLDSNFRLLADPRTLLGYGDFVVHRHHCCDNIMEEAKKILGYRKDQPEPVWQQVHHYQQQGFCTPRHPQRSHSATGVLLRHHTPEVQALNEAWWTEIDQHSHRDQLSLDYCAWRLGMTLQTWPGSVVASPYFQQQKLRRRYPLPNRPSVPTAERKMQVERPVRPTAERKLQPPRTPRQSLVSGERRIIWPTPPTARIPPKPVQRVARTQRSSAQFFRWVDGVPTLVVVK